MYQWPSAPIRAIDTSDTIKLREQSLWCPQGTIEAVEPIESIAAIVYPSVPKPIEPIEPIEAIGAITPLCSKTYCNY